MAPLLYPGSKNHNNFLRREIKWQEGVDIRRTINWCRLRKAILDIQAEREEKNEELREMFEKYTDEKITKEEFKAFSEKHRKAYFELTEKEDERIEVMKVMDRRNDCIEAWIKQFRLYRKDPTITRELVEVMVEKIVIHCEQKFIIEYNFRDSGLQP